MKRIACFFLGHSPGLVVWGWRHLTATSECERCGKVLKQWMGRASITERFGDQDWDNPENIARWDSEAAA